MLGLPSGYVYVDFHTSKINVENHVERARQAVPLP
jgi:hypothetical protein